MNRRFFVSAMAALVVGAGVLHAAPAAETLPADEPAIDLRPHFSAGQENRFRVTMVSRTQTQFLDTPRVRLQEYQQTIRVRRKVVEVADAGATLELVYEAVAVSLIAANKTIAFDSEGTNTPEAEERLGASVRNALKRPFTIKVDPTGRVLSVSGNEQVADKESAVNLIGADILSRPFGPMYGLAKQPPAGAVGETWSLTRETTGATGTFATTIRSTLKSVSGDRANIDLGGNIALDLSDKARAGKAELGAQDVHGHQVWNTALGIIDRSFYQQTMTVRADVEAKQPLETTGTIRRRQADTLLYFAIDRIDPGVGELPPLPPVPEAKAAPVEGSGAPRPAPMPDTVPAAEPVKKD